jgi:uncharacterized MAPEG superfamily protein
MLLDLFRYNPVLLIKLPLLQKAVLRAKVWSIGGCIHRFNFKLASLSILVFFLVYVLSYINEAEILRSFISESEMCDEEFVM